MNSPLEVGSMSLKTRIVVLAGSLLLLVTFLWFSDSRSSRELSQVDLYPCIEKLNSAKRHRSSNPAQKQTISLTEKVGIRKGALNAIGMEGRDVRGMATGDPGSVFAMLSHLGGLGEIIWVDDWPNFPVNLPTNYVPRRVAVRAALDAIETAGGSLINAGNERHLIVKNSEKEMYEAAIQALGWRDGKVPPWVSADTNFRSDAEVPENLPGIWHVDFSSPKDNGYKRTFTIAANGDFVSEGVDSEGIPLNRLSGTFKVEDGFLIQTITNTTQPNMSVPFVSRARIIHSDDKKLVFRHEGARVDSVLRKDMP